jgi:hypothetical protein
MKRVIIAIGGVALIIFAIQRQDIASALLALFITGHVPGTSLTLPFWAMIAGYCLLITAIVTHYVEGALALRREIKTTSSQQARMPRRRYSHI